jgi:uncharacterized SAM-binding protein YcdF (DUF218 family)
MPPVDSHIVPPSGDGPQPPPARLKPRAASIIVGGVVSFVAALIIGTVVAFPAGFLWFTRAVPSEEVPIRRSADGIVVLTGGAARIPDAMELLATRHGKRLLITGVNRNTSVRELAQETPRYHRYFACCVDLDYSAVNTTGNAAETRRWAKSRGFNSLIVVTSSYHMPRSMAELGHQLPDVELIPFPVVTEKMRAEPWWESLPTTKLLLSEYVKYIVARLRMRLETKPGSTDLAQARHKPG